MRVPAEDGLYLHHYKLAYQGVSEFGEKKMIKSKHNLLKDSTLRDLYREDLANTLEKLDIIR